MTSLSIDVIMIYNIQILRAIAAYLVVAHHVHPFIFGSDGDPGSSYIGASGVDIFFVISGFIMVFTCAGRDRSTVKFWQDRVIRVVPLYWLATFGSIGLFFIGFRPFGLHDFNASNLFTSLLFLPTLRPDGQPHPILSVGWTLIYEMFFYFLFGLSLLLRNQNHSVIILTMLFSTLWLVRIIFGPFNFTVSYYMQPLTLEFAAGCFLGLVYTQSDHFVRQRPYIAASVLMFIGVVIIISAGLFFKESITQLHGARLIFYGIPAVLIVLACLILEKSGKSHSRNFLVAQGAASYAIYLFHPILIQTTFKAAEKAKGLGIPISVGIVALIAFTLVCVIGALSHHWIEKPISRTLRGKMSGSGKTVDRLPGQAV